MPPRRPTLRGVIVWWVGIAAIGGLLLAGPVDVVYSPVVYLFVVMPITGLLLFPAAHVANRLLTPAISRWLGRPPAERRS